MRDEHKWDACFFNQICGYTPQSDTRYSGNNAITAVDANHYYTMHASGNDENITSSDKLTFAATDAAVERAGTLTPALRPIRVNGKDMWVQIVHPYQRTDLRNNTNTGQFLDIQKAAMTGGEITENPIFDGSMGVYNQTVFHADSRVTQGVNSSSGAAITTVRRSIFFGAQACMMAFGRDNGPEKFTWVEQLFDYGNQLGVASGSIFGIKKTIFNSADYADVVLSSYAVSH